MTGTPREPRERHTPGRAPHPGQARRPRSGERGAAEGRTRRDAPQAASDRRRGRPGAAPLRGRAAGDGSGGTARRRAMAARSDGSRAPRNARRAARTHPRSGAGGGWSGPPRRPGRLGDPRRRLRVLIVLVLFVLSLFAGRLVQLQGIDAASYAAQADRDRTETVTLAASRGEILDADGRVLATSVQAYDVVADPAQVVDPAATAAVLAPLVGLDTGATAQRLAAAKAAGSRYLLLAKTVMPEVWKQIQATQQAEEDSAPVGAGQQPMPTPLAGVYAVEQTKRVYPDGQLAANVIGFVDAQGDGKGGLEEQYDNVLAGRDGQMTYQEALGRRITTATVAEDPPRPGRNVQLTINSDIQWEAQKDIAAEVQASGAVSGTVVVEDATTGEILAMATAPTFDPNDIRQQDLPNIGNRALTEVYEPGSTSKVMTMAAALQEGVVSPLTKVTVPPQLACGGRAFHDDTPHGTEHLTLTGVLALSSNMGTILAEQQLGADHDQILYNYLRAFGIGSTTGLGFPGESGGILADPAHWNASQACTIPFGQGLALNSVQATSVYATIADGGVRIEPSLVKGTYDADGSFVPAPAPQRTRVISKQTAQQLAAMMESVVSDEGTAPAAEIPGYRVAGKTGTANRVDPTTGLYSGYTASFIGFAPADAPRLVVSVTLQNPINGHFGGTLAAPVFKQVMSFALQTLGVPPTGTQPPNLPTTW